MDSKYICYMSHTYTMFPDAVCSILQDEEGVCYSCDANDCIHLDDYEIVIPGIYDWYLYFNTYVDWVASKMEKGFKAKKFHRDGKRLAKEIRRQIKAEDVLYYDKAFEDDSGVVKRKSKVNLETYSRLAEKQLYALKKIVCDEEKETIFNNALKFISLSPKDKVFKDVKVSWDEIENEVDFIWDTCRLDCRASISKDDYGWRVWVGENHHCKDDPCDGWGFGGNEISEDQDWTFWFYDYMTECID